MIRSILILAIGAILVYTYISITSDGNTSEHQGNIADADSHTNAHDIASSMVDVILERMARDANYRVQSPKTERMNGGTVTYTAQNTYYNGDNLVKIVSSAKYNGVTKTVIKYSKRPGEGWVPQYIRAACTANGPLNNAIGDMLIDGRNHDLNGNIIPKTGVLGVSTSVEFQKGQNGSIGGTKDSVDYPISFSVNPKVIEKNYDWGGAFPKSPDEVLGYPEGTLKRFAQDGMNGSLYTANPLDLERRILSGVTYLELPSGKDGKIMLPRGIHKGILIVHNDATDSRIVNITLEQGEFQGLIIGDYMFHFHIDVLGSIILLSPDLEQKDNCDESINHQTFYSSETISAATGAISQHIGAPQIIGLGDR
ncbi:MAG: hypothetical protein JSW63_11555 [Ignavibacterium sp.]|nr:MAG: hypothetical protein JSW63_11555 [Ignavibacterium sp.]